MYKVKNYTSRVFNISYYYYITVKVGYYGHNSKSKTKNLISQNPEFPGIDKCLINKYLQALICRLATVQLCMRLASPGAEEQPVTAGLPTPELKFTTLQIFFPLPFIIIYISFVWIISNLLTTRVNNHQSQNCCALFNSWLTNKKNC